MEVPLQAQSAKGWKILAEDVLHWEKWGKQYTLYNSLSGETHILPELSARLLQQLSVHPRTVIELAGLFDEKDINESDDHDFVEYLTHLLVQLQAEGLTEQVQL